MQSQSDLIGSEVTALTTRTPRGMLGAVHQQKYLKRRLTSQEASGVADRGLHSNSVGDAVQLRKILAQTRISKQYLTITLKEL